MQTKSVALSLFLVVAFTSILLLMMNSQPTSAVNRQMTLGTQRLAPTVSVTLDATQDTYISSYFNEQNQNFENAGIISIQKDEFLQEHRGLIQFDLSSIPTGSIINSAQISLFQEKAWPIDISWLIYMYQVDQPWDAAKVTWNTAPTTSTVAAVLNTPTTEGSYLSWDVTGMIDRWVNDGVNNPNYGLEINSGPAGLIYLRTYSDMTNRTGPRLEIDYTPPPTVAAIPRDEKAVDVDNFCDGETEYAGAELHLYNDAFGTTSRLFLKHDGKNLYVCAEGVWGQLEERFFAVNLDTNLGQEELAGKEDLSLRVVTQSNVASAYRGSGDPTAPWTLDTIPGWTASAGIVTFLEREVAEFQIPLDLTTEICGQPFGLGIYHQDVGVSGDYFGWPMQENPNKPITWVTARLVDPEPCPTDTPTAMPSETAIMTPTVAITPTMEVPPTVEVTVEPTVEVTIEPTVVPTDTLQPSSTPTAAPTRTPRPTWTPLPTNTPTPGPTATPFPLVAAVPYFEPKIFTSLPPLVLPDLAIHGIELTQGIQCFNPNQGLAGCADNSLPLVAKKNSTARIYLRNTNGLQLSNVPVRLFIRANGITYEANASGRATAAINQGNTDSADVYFNVNFTNDITVEFYAIVDPNGTITESNESNNRFPASGFITKTFRKGITLDIVGQRLDYHPAGYTGTRLAGGWAVNGGAAGYVEQQLPIRTNGIDYSVKSGYLDWTKSLSSGDNQHDLIRILNARWMMENAFSWLFGAGAFTGAEYVYGWAPNSGYSGGHADMPVYPHAGGLGKVGIGTDQPGASTDNPGAGALIFAHELIHNYDVKHTDTGGDDCGSNDSTSDFPYASSSIQEFGFNPITGKIYNPANTHDVMSYCPAGGSKEGWLSPYTWNYMFSRLDATVMAAEAQVNRPQIMRTNGVSESLVVNLTIFNPDSAGFDPATPGALGELYRVPGGIEYLPIAGGYAIQLTNGEQVLSSQSFEVNFTSEYHGDGHTNGHSDAHTEGPSGEEPPFSAEPTSKVDRSFIMPWAEGATLVRLVKNEGESSTVLAEKAVSSSAPTVVITTPAADVDWPAGSTQTLAWSGDDGDGDSLSYSVLYSADSGQSWELLVSEWLTPSLELPVDALRGSNDARFRVVATDGINIGFDESDVAITIPNKAPEVTIISPFTGLTIGPGELAVLYGSASDLEDGSLADEAMVWSSNLQGDLGVGSSIPVNTLGAGNHTLTLTARDAQGISSSASVNVFVGVKLYLPLMME